MRIQLSDVVFQYDQDPVLQKVNLVIPSGSLTVFCGQTGSGKSTLLHVISGLEAPSSGTIQMFEPNPRRRTAIVFQLPETQIFAGSVREDIEYGLEVRGIPKRERTKKAEDALRNVGLEPTEFLERSPYLLSGGEKRRVVLAGALAMDPQVLILDEPTAGLDPAANRELLDVLLKLRARGLTILVSTHDLDLFFPLADQVVVMNQGQIQFQGDAAELVSTPDILEEAGLVLPAAARIAHRLRKKGLQVDIPVGVDGLVTVLKGTHFKMNQGQALPQAEESFQTDTEAEPVRWDWDMVQATGSVVQRLDPRMKWFGMVVLSFALLQISNGWGVAAAFLLIAGLMRVANLTWRKMVAYLRPFFIMFFFIWLVSAVSFSGGDVSIGPVGISYEGAMLGGLGVIRFLLVIALGLLFTETTTGAPLREGFEWGIRPLRKLKVPTRELSLAVSIALQFVPWILEKVIQLRKALASRGQDTIGMRKWTPRQVTLWIVPLLIMVIKMGDELATAIESRGYDKQAERTSWYQLNWTYKDTIVSLLVIGIAGLFWWLG